MKKIFLILIITSIFSSCEYDYDIDKYFDRFVPQIVLNSVITPDSLIEGDVFWSKSISDTSAFKLVDQFHVKLYENDNIIFDDQCSDGVIKTSLYPKEGASYKIELDIPKYGVVKASTNIPTTSTFTSSYDKEKTGSGSYYGNIIYRYYTIDDIVTSQKSRAIWVKAETAFSDKTFKKAINFYMKNAFCDQTNVLTDDMENGGTNVVARGSLEFHYHFIRIPYKNVLSAVPLKFSTKLFQDLFGSAIIGEDNWGYPIYKYWDIPVTSINMLVITPSDDYDKYYKSVYWQKYSGFASEIPIFDDPVNVYSNIDNGIGIFAGYSVSKIEHEVEQKEDDNEEDK